MKRVRLALTLWTSEYQDGEFDNLDALIKEYQVIDTVAEAVERHRRRGWCPCIVKSLLSKREGTDFAV